MPFKSLQVLIVTMLATESVQLANDARLENVIPDWSVKRLANDDCCIFNDYKNFAGNSEEYCIPSNRYGHLLH